MATSTPRRPRRSQAERSRATREQILDATFKILLKDGIGGIRLADVARLARTSRGGILHHFPTKDDLVAHTIERAYDILLDRTKNRVSRLSANDDPIEAMIADSRDLFFSEFFSVLNEMGKARARSRALTLVLTRKFRLPTESAYREALIARGLPHDLAEQVVYLTLSVVRGLSVRRQYRDEPEQFERTYAFFRKILWSFLASEGYARPGSHKSAELEDLHFGTKAG